MPYSSIIFDPNDPLFTGYQSEAEGIIDGFKQINIFVGPNNSGKSRFLRGFFASDGLIGIGRNGGQPTISLVAEGILNALSVYANQGGSSKWAPIDKNEVQKLQDTPQERKDLSHLKDCVKVLLKLDNQWPGHGTKTSSDLYNTRTKLWSDIIDFSDNRKSNLKEKRFYVPMLRSLR
jgi:hypothetical protein